MVINNSLISFLHQISFLQDDYITKTDLGHSYVFTQTIGFSHAVLVRCPKALIDPRFYVPGFTTDSKRALQTWLLVLSVIKSHHAPISTKLTEELATSALRGKDS